MGKLSLKIAGISCEVNSESDGFIEELKKEYKGFISQELPKYIINLSEREVDTQTGRLRIKEIREKNQRISDIIFRNIIIHFNHQKMEVEVEAPFNYNIFNSILRLLYPLFLIKEGGFLLHSAGVKKGKKAYIFYGRSSSGKTTIARLSEEYDLLSDELVAIKKEGKIFYAYSTPFWGEMRGENSSKKGEIKYLFKLKKGRNFRINKMDFKSAIKSFIPCVVFFSTDKDYTRKLFNLCVAALRENSTYELIFKPDKSLWKGIGEFETFKLSPKC